MKNKKILVTIFILIITLLIGTINVKAASYEIGASKKTVEVGEEVTITVKFVAAAWNVKVSGNGISGASYASQTSDLSETETVKTFKLDTSKAGTYTITVSGDITDANGSTQDLNKSCTVTVNEKPVTPKPEPEPEQPTTPDPKPETPVTPNPEPEQDLPKELEFIYVDNKTMYLETSTNFRSEYKIDKNNIITQLATGTEVIQIGISKTQSEGYTWSKIIFNGKTGYVINGNLTDQKTEEPEQPIEQPPVEETPTIEELQTVDVDKDETDIVKYGLQSLQIEGVTLSPTFSPKVYEYRTVVKENISELVINAVPAVGGATVTIAGNTKLAEGENLITIVVYNAEGNVEATYQVTVNKNTLDLSETDNMLKLGTKTARRNLIIFIAILVVALIALIVVMILRRKNQSDEEDDEEDEFTNNEENVENNQEVGEKVEQELTINEKNVEETVVEEEQVNEEDNQEEAQRPRRDKRKGKHF